MRWAKSNGLSLGICLPAAMLAAMLAVVPAGSNSIALADNAWPQWRGAERTGAAARSPALIDRLPDDGLRPQWKIEGIAGGGGGGWSSPVIADGRVYVFAHTKRQIGQPPERKYRGLTDEQRKEMSEAEIEEYEAKKREEDALIRTFFQHEDEVHCLDFASGETLWKNVKESVFTSFPESGTPAVQNGKLYLLAPGRRVRCLNAEDGKELWETVISDDASDRHVASSVAVVDGVVIALGQHVTGLDAKTGEIRWKSEKGVGGSHTSPAIWRHGDAAYAIVHLGGGETICLNVGDGRELWSCKTQAVHSTPLVVGDRLITYGSNRSAGLRCYELSLDGAEEAWMYRRVADKGSTPVAIGDYIYVQGEQRLACVSLADGQECWQTTMNVSSPQYTSPIGADGKIIYARGGILCASADADEFRLLLEGQFDRQGWVASRDAHRRALDLEKVEREEGQTRAAQVWQREVESQGPLECATPAIADGRLVVRLRNGLACYDLRAERREAEASQPKAAAR